MRPWGPTTKGRERAFQLLVFGILGVGVGGGGFEGAPGAAVVGGEVGAVGAYGDPELCGWGSRLRRSGSRGVG